MAAFDKWGVFNADGVETLPRWESHVMPCEKYGVPQPGHTWDADCSCDPRIEICMTGTVIVVHEMLPKLSA